jgi:hypothetical protein
MNNDGSSDEFWSSFKHNNILSEYYYLHYMNTVIIYMNLGLFSFYIDSVNADDKDKAELFLEEPIPQYEIENIKCPTVENAIMDLCNEILYFKDIDYANGDGNNGDIVFDVKERKIAITYEIKESRTDYL